MSRFILTRYILREHIGPFFFAFFVITLLFLLNLLFRELSRILSKGLPWHVVIEFFALNLAWIVALAVPMAVLTATLMAFGRFSSDNEITAMEAGGISIYRMIFPALAGAAVLAAWLIWFNNYVLPDFNHRTRLLASDISRKRPTISIEPGIWYDDIPKFGMLVSALQDSTGRTRAWNLLINDFTDKEKSRTISAETGLIELSEERGALILTLFDGEMQEIDIKKAEEFRRVQFPKHVLTIPVGDMFLKRSDSSYRGDREKSAQQMKEEVAENQAKAVENRDRILRSVHRGLSSALGAANPIADTLAANGRLSEIDSSDQVYRRKEVPPTAEKWRPTGKQALQVLATQKDTSRSSVIARALNQQRQISGQVSRYASMIRSHERKSKSLTVEIQKKYSIPVACIVFVLIGGPLGILSRRGGIATGGGVSLLFFLLYWTFLVGGEDLADRQIISPYVAMWSANFFVGIAGVILLVRASRQRLSFSLDKVLKLFKSKNRS